MKFNEAVEQATQSKDVEGVKKIFGKIVRRKVPAGYTVMSKGKKKKKKDDDEDEKELEELFTQMSPADDFHTMSKFWRGKKETKGTTEPKKKKKKKKKEKE